MKITQLMLARNFGGAERYFVDLSVELASRNYEVQVICHKNFKQSSFLETIPSIKLVRVSVAGWWDILAQKKIQTAIAEHNPSVVQAHLARGAYIAGKVCNKLGIPLIVKTHNYVNLKYYSRVDCFIPTTLDQQDYLLQQGINKNKIVVIPNFSSITPTDQVRTPDKDHILMIAYGRLVKKKGFHILLEAMKKLHDADRKVKLLIGGTGPERERLAGLTHRLGLSKDVTFYGWVDDIKAFVEEADLFILPSLDEPFGIAVLEMMALGKPVIATRTKGPLEILNHDIAWLVNPGDADDLASAIISAIDHQEESTEKAKKALQLFREKYAKDVVVPKLTALYEQLVKNKSNQS